MQSYLITLAEAENSMSEFCPTSFWLELVGIGLYRRFEGGMSSSCCSQNTLSRRRDGADAGMGRHRGPWDSGPHHPHSAQGGQHTLWAPCQSILSSFHLRPLAVVQRDSSHPGVPSSSHGTPSHSPWNCHLCLTSCISPKDSPYPLLCAPGDPLNDFSTISHNHLPSLHFPCV